MPSMNRYAGRFATIVADPADALRDTQMDQSEARRLAAMGKLKRVYVGDAYEPAYIHTEE